MVVKLCELEGVKSKTDVFVDPKIARLLYVYSISTHLNYYSKLQLAMTHTPHVQFMHMLIYKHKHNM